MRLVLVEAAVDEVAQIAPALRVALRDGAAKRGAPGRGEWIGGAGIIGGGVARERGDVAGCRKADAGDGRITRLVDQLVDRADLEWRAGRKEAHRLRVDELPLVGGN